MDEIQANVDFWTVCKCCIYWNIEHFFKIEKGKKKRANAIRQNEQNRNILSEAAMAGNWGNTSLNPKGGVSSLRFLEEENEQSALFYLCGLPAQFSLSVRLSLPFFPSCHGLLTAHRCGLFSAQVVCVCMWSLISSPEMPLYPRCHLHDLSFLLLLTIVLMLMFSHQSLSKCSTFYFNI